MHLQKDRYFAILTVPSPEIAALGFTCPALVSSQLSFTVSNRAGWIEFGLPAKDEKYLNLTYFLRACCALENSRFIFSLWILGIICTPLMVSTFRLSAKAHQSSAITFSQLKFSTSK